MVTSWRWKPVAAGVTVILICVAYPHSGRAVSESIAAKLYNHPAFLACQREGTTKTAEDLSPLFACVYGKHDYRAAEIIGEALIASGVSPDQTTSYRLANAYFMRGNSTEALHYARLGYSRIKNADKSNCQDNPNYCSDFRKLLTKLNASYSAQFVAEDAQIREQEDIRSSIRTAWIRGVLGFGLLALIIWAIVAYNRATAKRRDAEATERRAGLRQFMLAPLQPIVDSGLNLKTGEICYYQSPGVVYTLHKHTHYEGGYSGVSFRVARGVWFRTGGGRGAPVTNQAMEPDGQGTVYVTNERFAFVGPIKSIDIPFTKVETTEPYTDGIKIDVANKSPVILSTGSELLYATFQRIKLGYLNAVPEDKVPS